MLRAWNEVSSNHKINQGAAPSQSPAAIVLPSAPRLPFLNPGADKPSHRSAACTYVEVTDGMTRIIAEHLKPQLRTVQLWLGMRPDSPICQEVVIDLQWKDSSSSTRFTLDPAELHPTQAGTYNCVLSGVLNLEITPPACLTYPALERQRAARFQNLAA